MNKVIESVAYLKLLCCKTKSTVSKDSHFILVQIVVCSRICLMISINSVCDDDFIKFVESVDTQIVSNKEG